MTEEARSETSGAVAHNAMTAQFRLMLPEASEMPTAYANLAQVTVTPHDLTLFFSWYATPPLTEAPDGPVEVPVRPVVAVTLPLTVAGPLVDVLKAQLELVGQPTASDLSGGQDPADKGDES